MTVLVSVLSGIITIILHFDKNVLYLTDLMEERGEQKMKEYTLDSDLQAILDAAPHRKGSEGNDEKKIDLTDITERAKDRKRQERRVFILAGITSFSEGFVSAWIIYLFAWWFAYELLWGVVIKRYIIEGGFKGKK